MALLDATNRTRVLAYLMRTFAHPGLTKPDVQAAIVDMDTFLETNAAVVNSAFSLPFRTTATTAQKLTIIALVAMRRAGLLKVAEDN